MTAITRRALLSRTLLLAAVGGGALVGLTRSVSHKVAVPPPRPPEALTSALSRQQALLEGYDRVLAAKVGSDVLTGLRADVSEHGAALRALLERYPGWRLSQAGTASATGTVTATGTAGATGTVTATLPEAAPVPGTVAGLAAASTSAAKALRASAMDWAAGEAHAAQVVPVLGSISASLFTHAQVLS